MRLPNFLSTVSNRASLSITQTLYDRRALDCTSSKPLVQSLQRLMVLTSSSSRVRETLCLDGGLERLIQIMKETSDPDGTLSAFKWHLCMQCLLNLGARGSETVRMRVLEAGAIPVIATVLDNYLVAHGDSLEHRDRDRENRQRKQPQSVRTAPSLVNSETSQQTHTNLPQNGIMGPSAVGPSGTSTAGTLATLYVQETAQISAGDIQPQPGRADSTVEPNRGVGVGVGVAEHFLEQFSQATGRVVRSRRAQNPNEETPIPIHLSAVRPLPAADVDQAGMAQFVNGLLVPREQDVFWALEIIAFVSKYSHLRREMQETHFLPQLSLRPHEELFASGSDGDDADCAHECSSDCSNSCSHESSSECDQANCHQCGQQHKEIGFDSAGDMRMHESDETDFDEMDHDGSAAEVLAAFRAFESEKMKVSLPIGDEIERAYYTYDFENSVDYDDEYLTKSVNLFELVERFTAFRSPREFPHWACIIMRNFVRKDEGGIRQCANFACGKWEEFPRQFAKCRRCKRTKYCSKPCQLKAWSMHRYWCAPSPSSQPSTQTTVSQANGVTTITLAENPQTAALHPQPAQPPIIEPLVSQSQQDLPEPPADRAGPNGDANQLPPPFQPQSLGVLADSDLESRAESPQSSGFAFIN